MKNHAGIPIGKEILSTIIYGKWTSSIESS